LNLKSAPGIAREIAGSGFCEASSGRVSTSFDKCETADPDGREAFTLRDLAACWRVPWYLVTGSWEIVVILVKDLFSVAKAGSFYRVSGFKTSKDDPLLVARRVLAIVYTTTAPNFIVIGIDYTKSRMLFHQLERSGEL